MGDACRHSHGGTVPGLPGWVCGQCWQNLDERPKRYGMEATIRGEKGHGPRQIIIWQAAESRSAEGMTLGQFVLAVAQRFAVKGRLNRASAMELALSSLRGLREVDAIGEFGSPASEWSREAAQDIADEEMTYWDADGDMRNG